MEAATLALQTLTEGDTWGGLESLDIDWNGAPPANKLRLVRMQFRRRGVLGMELSSKDGRIWIMDRDNWTAQVIGGPLNLTRGTWEYDIEFHDGAGHVYTLLKGKIKITKGTTK
mgnify:CR=1 FL=1